MDGLREGTLDRAAQSTGMMFFGADVAESRRGGVKRISS
jgi:hypothetical protein